MRFPIILLFSFILTLPSATREIPDKVRELLPRHIAPSQLRSGRVLQPAAGSALLFDAVAVETVSGAKDVFYRIPEGALTGELAYTWSFDWKNGTYQVEDVTSNATSLQPSTDPSLSPPGTGTMSGGGGMRHWRSRVIVTLFRKDDGPGTAFGEKPMARYHAPIEWTDCGDGRPLQWWLMTGTCVGWTSPYGFDKTFQFRAAECRRRIITQSARRIEVERYGRWNLNVKTDDNPQWVTAGVLSFFFYQLAGEVNDAQIPMGALMWEDVPNGPGADWIDARQIYIGVMREAPILLDPTTSWACPGATSGESAGTTGSGTSGAEMEVNPTGTGDTEGGEACHEVIRGETNEVAGTCCGTTMEEIIACAAKFQ